MAGYFSPCLPYRRTTAAFGRYLGGVRIVEGNLSSGAFKFPVSLRVFRAAIHFHAHRGSGRVVWQEDASEDLPVHIEGFPNARCLISLESDNASILVSELGELDKSGLKRISLRHFRDSLAVCKLAAAEFRIQVGNLASVATGHYFTSAVRIAHSLPEESMNAMIFRLPDIGPALRLTRELIDRPLSDFLNPSEVDVPYSLTSFLCGVAYGAVVFDNTHVAGDLEEIKKMAPRFTCSVVDWLKKAETSACVLGGEQELLDEYPSEAATLLPVPRWQDALRQRLRWVKNNRDLPDLIRAWRIAINCPPRSISKCNISLWDDVAWGSTTSS
jgi:hypothetical protein